ncbi:NAD(P)H-hydrate epimerase [Corynebacterium glyciniphilum]|uniref:NAD(P)H-hydrate epimerase n=1 Tax=Corynebacterium glyciniphilum TaxID=1404244 RepID=UPI0011AB7651|nr:NAD(P)H-hydrate epimerase [Corynebacterium glyciniphilum]
MWTVYTGEQYRAALEEWDRRETGARGSGRHLHQHADYGEVAYAVADCVEAKLSAESRPRPVVLLVGAGGNGRDGLRAGTELLHRGYRVEVVLFPEPGADDDIEYLGRIELQEKWRNDVNDDSREQLATFLAVGGSMSRMTGQEEDRQDCVVVDAISGRGIDGPLRGPAIEWAEFFWGGRKVIAVDLPTGIDPDNGSARGNGFFPASTTVVIGGLRAAHVLHEDCGRLVFVSGGMVHLLQTIEQGSQAAGSEQGVLPDEHSSVRVRFGYLAQDPGEDDPLPGFTNHPDGWERGDSSPWCRQILGTLGGDAYDRHLREAAGPPTRWNPREESLVGVAGHPVRRPGAAAVVAAGALGSTAWGVVAHPSAAVAVSQHFPQVEVVADPGKSGTRGASWVVCSGASGADFTAAACLIITRDAVLDWIADGIKPPDFVDDQQIIALVDRDTAVEALTAWGESRRTDIEDQSVVCLAERMASSLDCRVVLSGQTTVYVESNTTIIIRSGGGVSVQGYEELLAGAVAAAGTGEFSSTNTLIALFVLPRAVAEAARRIPAVAPIAQHVAEAIPEALREWRVPLHRV